LDSRNLYLLHGIGLDTRNYLTAGVAAELAGLGSRGYNLIQSNDDLYWVEAGSNYIRGVSKAGGLVTPSISAASTVDSLLLDGSNMYWSDSAGIHLAPATGGTKSDLSSYRAVNLFAEGPFLYFSDHYYQWYRIAK
jgi:hypothetical protein